MKRNLFLSGGIYHPFAETSASIANHLAGAGVSSEICGLADGLERLGEEDFDLLTVNALGFSMTQAEKYAPLRGEYAFAPSDADKAAIRAHVNSGRGLLGIHTAAICFDTWPEWRDLLGVAWVWGSSHHPAPDYLEVAGEGGDFRIWDELYSDLWIAPDARVLATARLRDQEIAQPVMTVRDRSVYLALGHDMTATQNTGFKQLLDRAATIALGMGAS